MPGASMPGLSKEIMEAAQKMAQQMLPYMLTSMGLPEDSSWTVGLKPSVEQTHCFVSQLAFEADETEIRAYFSQCGEIEKFYMPKKNLSKKAESFQAIALKLQQNASHQGKAIIKFKDRMGLNAAMAANGDSIKGKLCVLCCPISCIIILCVTLLICGCLISECIVCERERLRVCIFACDGQ